jgi:hypothetical protein
MIKYITSTNSKEGKMKDGCDLVQLFKEVSAFFDKGLKNINQTEYDTTKKYFMTIYEHLFPPYVIVCDGTHPRKPTI